MTDTHKEESSVFRDYASPEIIILFFLFLFDLIIISMATNCNIKMEQFAFK